ncbi:MAG: DUF559 domain-containing protein [Sphingobacteriales bacterium]|nr:MAG: DUF559 domain-containing protein [Sphingobacteriales bacterium]
MLWQYLCKNQCCGVKFRRQHPLLYFIADFYCHQAGLVVEIDGSIHQIKEQYQYDVARTAELEQLGIKVIRFTNEAVIADTKAVFESIKQTVQNRLLFTP